jgi:bifunctional polynucleotide phosphatase/kinase
MVGDALGRPGDHSDCDLMFAKNVGVKCLSPEGFFKLVGQNKNDDVIKPNIPVSTQQEIVIMMGYPGSGKSTLAKEVFETRDDYLVLHGDDFKTPQQMFKSAEKSLQSKEGKSLVIDATHPSKEKRKVYVDLARKYDLQCRCIYVNTSQTESLLRNKQREKPVPFIVYALFNKKFETPLEEEGFSLTTTT